MAPREVTKATPKVQRVVSKSIASRSKASPASSVKKVVSTTKTVQKITKMTTIETRQRTSTVPKVSTPKSKENKPVQPPASASKKSTWKRRPKPAHSGVPVPEKMRQLMQKQFQQNLAKNV